MKTIIISLFSLLITQITFAQTGDSTSYPVVIQFNSECCGVPSATPVKNYIKTYRKKYKIKKMTAVRIGPMGREGEYWLAFPLKELTPKQASIFKNGLKKVIAGLKKPGKAVFEADLRVVSSELPGRVVPEKVVY